MVSSPGAMDEGLDNPAETPAYAAESAPDGPNGKRWPAIVALFTAWTRPAATTLRVGPVALWKAFLVHAFAGLLAVWVVNAADAWWQTTGEERPIPQALIASAEIATKQLWSWLVDTSFERKLDTLIGVAIVELCVLLGALLIAPFGARLESVRDSIVHAIRRTWLHGGALVAALVAGYGLIFAADSAIERTNTVARKDCVEQFPDVEDTVSNATPSPAQKEVWAKRAECWENHPATWKADAARFLAGFGNVALGAAVLVTWMLGITAARAVRSSTWPPTCRSCGYNLTGLDPAGRCSECGEFIAASLGEDNDPGAPWEHRKKRGRAAALARTMKLSLTQPKLLARRLRLVPRDRGYVLLLIPQALAAACVPVVLFRLAQAMTTSRGDELRYEIALLAAETVALAVVALLIIAAAALIAGLKQSWSSGRNVLGGTAQVAVYAGAYLVLGAWLCGLLAAVHLCIDDQLTRWARKHDIATIVEVIAVSAWVGIIGFLVVGYIVRVVRASSAVRYARR